MWIDLPQRALLTVLPNQVSIGANSNSKNSFNLMKNSSPVTKLASTNYTVNVVLMWSILQFHVEQNVQLVINHVLVHIPVIIPLRTIVTQAKHVRHVQFSQQSYVMESMKNAESSHVQRPHLVAAFHATSHLNVVYINASKFVIRACVKPKRIFVSKTAVKPV